MSESEIAVMLEGVEKHYGHQRVLRVQSLRLEVGETVTLCGSNGSGKSTLLRLIGGISTPDQGSVHYAPSLRASPLAYVPQSGGLYRELSLEQNFALRRQLYGLPTTSVAGAWYVEELALAGLLHKRVDELSGGFQRLACVAAALHVEPQWLLIDEPFSGVDSQKHALLADRLRALSRQLKLLVVATPFPQEFAAGARMIQVRNGEIE